MELDERIMIIGSGGSGKSTLARALGHSTGLPVIHLDAYYWQPGWVPTPEDEWRGKVKELASQPRWIIDGNFASTMEIRLSNADRVVWLDYNRYVCLYRALRRQVAGPAARPDMADGCPEHFDIQFLRWIWRFPTTDRPAIEELLALYPSVTVSRLHSRSLSETRKLILELN